MHHHKNLARRNPFVHTKAMKPSSFQTQIPWIEDHFIEIFTDQNVVIDLKYATADNFVGKDVYQGFNRCFLSPLAAKKFQSAQEALRKLHPDLHFRIWDALRPRSVQKEFYEFLKGTPNEIYIAPPEPGSLHNFGMAVDLTLQKKSGELLDMGTDFDDFRDLAQPLLEKKLLLEKRLTLQQFENRQILRRLMHACGFQVLDHEWWHFNALPREQVFGHFPSLD